MKIGFNADDRRRWMTIWKKMQCNLENSIGEKIQWKTFSLPLWCTAAMSLASTTLTWLCCNCIARPAANRPNPMSVERFHGFYAIKCSWLLKTQYDERRLKAQLEKERKRNKPGYKVVHTCSLAKNVNKSCTQPTVGKMTTFWLITNSRFYSNLGSKKLIFWNFGVFFGDFSDFGANFFTHF